MRPTIHDTLHNGAERGVTISQILSECVAVQEFEDWLFAVIIRVVGRQQKVNQSLELIFRKAFYLEGVGQLTAGSKQVGFEKDSQLRVGIQYLTQQARPASGTANNYDRGFRVPCRC